MDTQVDVLNPSLVLVPGMYAEVNLSLMRRDAVLSIPLTAVDIESQESLAVRCSGRLRGHGHGGDAQQPRGSAKSVVGMQTANEVEVRSGLKRETWW